MKIDNFKGKYRFLSNFYPVTVVLDEVTYPSVEHAYQAAKTLDPRERHRILTSVSAGEAKRAGRIITLRPEWDSNKLDIMCDFLRQKFHPVREPQLAAMLRATNPATLVEGNTWGDTYWGVCKGVGENHLGKLLMAIRDDIGYLYEWGWV